MNKLERQITNTNLPSKSPSNVNHYWGFWIITGIVGVVLLGYLLIALRKGRKVGKKFK